MKIERTSQTTLSPRAREELMYRQSVKYFNGARELRNPLGIYNVSLHNIWESFTEVLDELDIVLIKQSFRETPPSDVWDKTLMRRQERLIADLMRYFDDCLSVLCCFYPKASPKPEADRRWFIDNNQLIKTAWNSIHPYRDAIANIENHIKHHQGALRGIAEFNSDSVVVGYFVEHIDRDGILEPHPEVHKPYRGLRTAFSFYRDLRLNFFLVYAVSELVADAIEQMTQPTPNVLEEERTSDTIIFEIAERIAKLPKRVFKDEQQMDFPEVDVKTESGIARLTIECPSTRTILPASSGTYSVVVAWVGDAVTRTVGFPYFDP